MSPTSLPTACLLAGLLGLALGCPALSIEPVTPCESGENNKLDDDGTCECRSGYEWCVPQDPSNLNCCEEDLGSTTGDDCSAGNYPPELCTPEQEDSTWCTHSKGMSPCGGLLFVCKSGVWVDDSEEMQSHCENTGYDFAYGCVDNGEETTFECGNGPGTDCISSTLHHCVSEDVIGYCLWGKESWESCQQYCQEVGMNGQTYDYGECNDSIVVDVKCSCSN